MSTRKINVALATVWFVYWSRKEMRVLFKKAFQQDPSRGWANTSVTGCKQSGRPEPCGHKLQPLVPAGLPVLPGLCHTALTAAFSVPSSGTEEAIPTCHHARSSHPPGEWACESPVDAHSRAGGMGPWGGVHAQSRALCSQAPVPEVDRVGPGRPEGEGLSGAPGATPGSSWGSGEGI